MDARLDDRHPSTMLSRAASGRSSLHRDFRLQACDIAIDRRDCKNAAAALVPHQAILAGDAALHADLVPPLGMADIIDGHVVMLAPEERHIVESLALSQHV